MNAKPDDGRSAETTPRPSGAAREQSRARGAAATTLGEGATEFMVAARDGTTEVPKDRLKNEAGIEIRKIISGCGGVVMIRATAEKAEELRTTQGLVVEPDDLLLASSLAAGDMTMPLSSAPGFTTTIQVTGENSEPVDKAEVHVVGTSWTCHGITAPDGKARVSIFGETPESIVELIVKPRGGYWPLLKARPKLQPDAVSTVGLRSLPAQPGGWPAATLRLDQLPEGYTGKGIRIGLIDTGVATGHRQLTGISRGVDLAGGQEWSNDPAGHGTLLAGILVGSPQAGPLRGVAPEAELMVVRLPPDARSGDLAAALDACIDQEMQVIVLGFGCQAASEIIDRRLDAAKRKGMAVIAAAGNRGGPVQFPACSPSVLAVGAVGRQNELPADAPHTPVAAGPVGADNLFIPAFSASGPEIDICAPGVAVFACQAPDGYTIADGTSIAAAHVAGLAALLLAHHPDFRGAYAERNGRRVERLFQVIKETARPLAHLDPGRSGAGLADAAFAFGVAAPAPITFHRGEVSARMDNLRAAMRLAGLTPHSPRPVARGAAATTQNPLTRPSTLAPPGGGLKNLRVAMTMAGLRQNQ